MRFKLFTRRCISIPCGFFYNIKHAYLLWIIVICLQLAGVHIYVSFIGCKFVCICACLPASAEYSNVWKPGFLHLCKCQVWVCVLVWYAHLCETASSTGQWAFMLLFLLPIMLLFFLYKLLLVANWCKGVIVFQYWTYKTHWHSPNQSQVAVYRHAALY